MDIDSTPKPQWSLTSAVGTVVQATIVTAAVATITIVSYVPKVGKKHAASPATVSVACVMCDATLARSVQVAVDPQALKWMKFQALIHKWHEERGATSSITTMSMSQAYQGIIGMGDDAVSLIITQLEAEGSDPDHWFWALKAITGASPIKPEDRGNSIKMAQSWIEWAKEQGYSV